MAHMGDRRGVYRFLVGRPERTPLGRPRRRWEDNIKIDLQDGVGDMDSIARLRTRTGGGR